MDDPSRIHPVKLEDLTSAPEWGVVVAHAVCVESVRWHGTNAPTVTYRADDGGVAQRILYREHEPELRVEQRAGSCAFDCDPALFRLVMKALRIRMAGRHDPMLAGATSDLDALPHQIKAV